MRRAVGLFLMGLGVVPFASASIIPSFEGTSGGVFDPTGTAFSYIVRISADQRLDTGDPGAGCGGLNVKPDGCRPADQHLVVIYDFAGYIAGSEFTTAADWTFAGAFDIGIDGATYPGGLPPKPSLINAEDDPTLPNLVWVWTPEGGMGVQFAGYRTDNAEIGLFGAESTFEDTTDDTFQGAATKNNYTPGGTPVLEDDGTMTFNDGNVPVPFDSGFVIPEPSTYMMMAGGFAALALLRRRKSA